MLDELGDAAGVAELGAARFAGLGVGGALVGERDFQALVEEGHLAQALGQRVVVEFGGSEDGLVGQEVDLGAAALAGAGLLQLGCGNALGIALLVGVAGLAGFSGRQISTSNSSLSALTQLTPTPCRPPETL
jgi:hypothetical protein